eukprot:CAMPEP_0196652464 /NCGR_PEP_ID=MMETSP1086-20130531/1765_1 /TAXON_ID=77921 /ORGANISM="Cyanoptyche  gloeocystis , Strain SAG4.97" /LENGTH=67 /DNA_ID=CAMNT_0041983027 /DNA_START=257 /DNA_END=457 /DNA_ORIENTATION=-
MKQPDRVHEVACCCWPPQRRAERPQCPLWSSDAVLHGGGSSGGNVAGGLVEARVGVGEKPGLGRPGV